MERTESARHGKRDMDFHNDNHTIFEYSENKFGNTFNFPCLLEADLSRDLNEKNCLDIDLFWYNFES